MGNSASLQATREIQSSEQGVKHKAWYAKKAQKIRGRRSRRSSNVKQRKLEKDSLHETEITITSRDEDISLNASSSITFTAGNVVMSISMNDPVPEDAPEALKIVREFVRYKDAHDVDKMMKYLNMERCDVHFVDSDTEFPVRDYLDAAQAMYTGFPDLHFYWKQMHVLEPEQGVGTWVVVEDYYGIGKHTGDYVFGPYEAISATGILVQDDPIEHGFLVGEDGKICKSTVNAWGKIVGPPGFYQKVGGLIM